MSALIALYPALWLNRSLWQSGIWQHLRHLEDWLLVLAWLFALIAMSFAWIYRKTPGPPLLAALGLGLLTLALKSPLHHAALAGSLVALTGGVLLATAHGWNLKNRKNGPLPLQNQN